MNKREIKFLEVNCAFSKKQVKYNQPRFIAVKKCSWISKAEDNACSYCISYLQMPQKVQKELVSVIQVFFKKLTTLLTLTTLLEVPKIHFTKKSHYILSLEVPLLFFIPYSFLAFSPSLLHVAHVLDRTKKQQEGERGGEDRKASGSSGEHQSFLWTLNVCYILEHIPKGMSRNRSVPKKSLLFKAHRFKKRHK